MLTLFGMSLALILYVYFGYPLLLWLGAFGVRRGFESGNALPCLSILVAAHNEETTIAAKIENLLAADYPRSSLEILVGDDGSSDRTSDIVRSLANEGVRLVSLPIQQGKSAMQNRLAAASSGDVMVFTDADCLIPRGALRSLVRHFADPRIGLVTARPRFANENQPGVVGNESLYLRYETWLRNEESARGILALASGSLFAMRRALWGPLDPALGDDFVLPLRVARAGMRSMLDLQIVTVTRLSQDQPLAMLRLKTRIISKDFRALLAQRGLLNPLRYGPLAVALLSHKLLRWFVPYFLAAVLTSNLFLLALAPFRIFAILQALFYAGALVGFVRRGRRTSIVCSLPMSFCVVNLAALLGTLHCLFGGTFGRWKPDRTPSSLVLEPTSPVMAQGSATTAPSSVSAAARDS